MAKSPVTASRAGVSTASGTSYIGFGNGAFFVHTSSETEAQVPMRTAGTVSQLWTYIATNDRTATSSITLRKAATDTALTVSIGAGLTGEFSDTSNSVSVSAGDLINWKLIVGTGGASFIFNGTMSVYQTSNDSITVSKYINQATGSSGHTFASNFYNCLAYNLPTSTTEAGKELRMATAGTFRNLSVYNVANTANGNTVVRLRLNNANTALASTIGSAVANTLSEATGTDIAVVAGDLVNFNIDTTASSAGTISISFMSVEFVTTNNKSQMMGAVGSGQAVNAAAGGATAPLAHFYNSNDATTQLKAMYGFTLSDLAANITTNTTSAGSPLARTKINGSSGAQTAAITLGTTGVYRDTTHTDTLVSSSLINIQYVAGTVGDFTTFWHTVVFTDPATYGGSSPTGNFFAYM